MRHIIEIKVLLANDLSIDCEAWKRVAVLIKGATRVTWLLVKSCMMTLLCCDDKHLWQWRTLQ